MVSTTQFVIDCSCSWALEVYLEEFESAYVPVVERRSRRWAQVLGDGSGDVALNDPRIKRFVRKGIPPELRPKLWPLLSGAEDEMRRHPKEFSRLCKIDAAQAAGHQIDLDLHRTFPDNASFASLSGGKGKEALGSVLHCVATKHPNVGYCQGLNYLGGMLLLVTKEPETAFWMLESRIRDILDYYTPGMRGLKVDVLVLRELLRRRSKELDALLTRLDFDLLLVTSKWFICWYMEVLPVETTMRIWDCLFHEGPKILFRVALTLLLKNKVKLLAVRNFGELVETLQNITRDEYALNCHKFLEDMFTIPGTLAGKTIDDLRRKYSAELSDSA